MVTRSVKTLKIPHQRIIKQRIMHYIPNLMKSYDNCVREKYCSFRSHSFLHTVTSCIEAQCQGNQMAFISRKLSIHNAKQCTRNNYQNDLWKCKWKVRDLNWKIGREWMTISICFFFFFVWTIFLCLFSQSNFNFLFIK